ncbi:MAG: beta-N-acetylhexosaminidase [Hyphomicrobiaceae bacterium]
MLKAFVTGVAGLALTGDEIAFLRQERPAGLILFDRNCGERAQLQALVAAFKDAVGCASTLVLIDQEGGRVQRLKPPFMPRLPPAAAYGLAYGRDRASALQDAEIVSHWLATELSALGVTVNCVPVLDLPVPGANAIIGDRAYGTEVADVVALGRAVARGMLAGGVLPVMKHVPGHGRATKDSHLALPVVDTAADVLADSDFAPFRALRDLPMAMTAHVVYTALDATRPASISEAVVRTIIRGRIGFDGLLISDDLSMHALTGPMQVRAAAVIASGSDLALHCNGDLAEMAAVASAVPVLSGRALERYQAALGLIALRRPAMCADDSVAALGRIMSLLG